MRALLLPLLLILIPCLLCLLHVLIPGCCRVTAVLLQLLLLFVVAIPWQGCICLLAQLLLDLPLLLLLLLGSGWLWPPSAGGHLRQLLHSTPPDPAAGGINDLHTVMDPVWSACTARMQVNQVRIESARDNPDCCALWCTASHPLQLPSPHLG
jgi:hypothetical protein